MLHAWHLPINYQASFFDENIYFFVLPNSATKTDDLKYSSTFNTAWSVRFSAKYAEQSKLFRASFLFEGIPSPIFNMSS